MIVNVKNILITLFFLISANIIKSVKDEDKDKKVKVEVDKGEKAKNDADAIFKGIDIEEGKIEINKDKIKEALEENKLIKEEIKPNIEDKDINNYKQEDNLTGYEDALKAKNSDEKPKEEINQNITPVEYKAKVEKNGSCCNF